MYIKKCKVVLASLLMLVMLFTCGGIPVAAQEAGNMVSAESTSLVFGDANGDGNVNAIDYALMQKYIQKKMQVFPYSKAICTMDVNGDGLLDSLDAVLVNEFILGNISAFPVEDVIRAMPERVFEYHYVNNAWGSVDQGIYIDNGANVHFYNNVTGVEKVVGSISKTELQEKYLLLFKASFGGISSKTHEMFDAGAMTYTGNILKNGIPQQVFLSLEGDFRQRNLSPYTEDIVSFINQAKQLVK